MSLLHLFGLGSVSSTSMAQASRPQTSTETTPAISAYAAAEPGKIKMYSPEYYKTCAIGGCDEIRRHHCAKVDGRGTPSTKSATKQHAVSPAPRQTAT